jgi:hypothetical protein
MEAIPTGQGPTRTTRGRSATNTKVDRPKAAAKPSARKAQVQQTATLDPAEISQTIATTAYFLAAARNFEPGHELEDWLEAERRVQAAEQ